ncbi:FG-GAP-like repeat-containing protein [bacterium]|nr:FG-GAP-like repeat-containing protein [bacterium]
MTHKLRAASFFLFCSFYLSVTPLLGQGTSSGKLIKEGQFEYGRTLTTKVCEIHLPDSIAILPKHETDNRIARVQTSNDLFNVTYINLSQEAQAAAQLAFDIWSEFVYSPVAIDAVVSFGNLEGSLAGFALTKWFEVSPPFVSQHSFYPLSLLKAFVGVDQLPDSADFKVILDDTKNFYTGLDGHPPADESDLVTVMMHEIGHGLGISGFAEVDAQGLGSWDFNGLPAFTTTFLEDAAGNQIIDTNIYPNPSTSLTDVFTSEQLFFAGFNTAAANGGDRARMFAPQVFSSVSSIYHFDESTYGDNPNSLMTPATATGVAIHDPGPLTLAVLYDLGWGQTTFFPLTNFPFLDRSIAATSVDFNQDNALDLFIANGGPGGNDFQTNELWLSDGAGTLNLIEEGDIATDISNSMGASWGDYNNDGFPDLFLTNHLGVNGNDNVLYRNESGNSFTKILDDIIVTDGGNSSSASWADYDNDGHLDMFVANSALGNNFLYRGNGDGSFTKITTGPIATESGSSTCGVWGDYNNDGHMDLFVANNGPDNFLYQNNGDGSFTKVTSGIVVDDGPFSFSWGASWGDYNNDDHLDLFVANHNTDNFIYGNNGDGTFTKITQGPVVSSGGASRGSAWADIDNDGDLDLYVTNTNNQPNFLYVNNGNGEFLESVPKGRMQNEALSSFGVSWADFNRDGALDLTLTNWESSPSPGKENTLYFNNGNQRNWIDLKLVGTNVNRSALGARVRVLATINEQRVWQMREISALNGFGSQNQPNAHFGLGDATVVDSMHILWPGGGTQTQTNVAPNQFLQLIEGRSPVSVEDRANLVPETIVLHQNYPNPFNPSTTIPFELPTDAFVELRIYNLLGKEVTKLFGGRVLKGRHAVTWNGKDHRGLQVGSGLFIYQIKIGERIKNRKMLLMR